MVEAVKHVDQLNHSVKVAAPSVKVPLAVLRFVKFGEAAPGGGPPGGVLGLLLRHLSESLLRRAVDAEAAAEAFGALRRYDDVREGMLLVLDGLVRPRLPGRAQAPELHQKLKVVRQELAKGPVEKPAKAAKASPRFL
ncbi:unnamed protein product [Prorocentrum cordatum]|uniref:Uncharacterized protein n=1 Tax=Prorocentrum cordatum TaxID=2364126 RepID=A0ABN9RC30_9DINO|nr:unnamed protein product [Polarella glacialis]